MIHGFTEPFAYYGSVVWRALRDTFRHFAREVVVGVILLVLATWIRCATLPRGQECEIGDFKAGLAAGNGALHQFTVSQPARKCRCR